MLHNLIDIIKRNLGDNSIYDGYFDHEWYLNEYIEEILHGKREKRHGHFSALHHYLGVGWRIGYNPSPYFDTKWYLEKYAEVCPSDMEPLRHYLEKGWHEGRSPSPYFDSFWYLRENKDVAKSGMEPLRHYLQHGWREMRNPNPYFERSWYGSQISLSEYRDCEPLRHYLEKGWSAGLSPGPGFDPEEYLRRNPACREAGDEPLKHFLLSGDSTPNGVMLSSRLATHSSDRERPSNQLRRERAVYAPTPARCFALSSSPLVSIIIANFNGAAHLKDLFESLEAQTYENFEIIFVDDSSNDNSVEIARSYVERVVGSQKRVGFAEANNLGLQQCRGELIALLNNDMRVDANWLENMVSTIRQNPLIAAVAPKIRFWTKFQRLRIEGTEAFELDESALLDSLEYKKLFVSLGVRRGKQLCAAPEKTGSAIVLHVPVQTQPIRILLRTEQAQEIKIITSDIRMSSLSIAPGTTAYSFTQCEADRREGYFVINNAGSALNANLEPYDRGFGHIDSGEFNHPEEIELLCGGSALIRRDALHGRKLFISELLAYYEDSELSVWLRDNGYKIVYCPTAVVYHKHSSTTVERSAYWLRQTSRNKIIFDYIVADLEAKHSVVERGKLHLNHVRHWYKNQPNATASELEFARQIPDLYGEIEKIVALVDSGDAIKNCTPRIGIFNPYWTTLGGGEAHALEVASALTRFGQVELISTTNFDVKRLMEYFGYGDLNVRKRIIQDFVSEITRDYDIFVNSCFLDKTPSLAKKSYFIVSFPSRQHSEAFLRSYHFLPNSGYTLECMRKFWGESTFVGKVLYPSVPSAFYVTPRDKQRLRKKVILSVGRFVSTGHIKNQLEVAEAFRKFVAHYPGVARGWALVFVGSVNDMNYLSKVREVSAGLDVVLATQASFEDLCRYYREASIYVHASGYGRDQDTEPELFEHFGIVVAQALASGCFPLVFDGGGPKEIIEAAGVGKAWRSLDELAEGLRDAVLLLSSSQGECMSRKAIHAAEAYSTGRLASQMNKLVLYGG